MPKGAEESRGSGFGIPALFYREPKAPGTPPKSEAVQAVVPASPAAVGGAFRSVRKAASSLRKTLTGVSASEAAARQAGAASLSPNTKEWEAQLQRDRADAAAAAATTSVEATAAAAAAGDDDPDRNYERGQQHEGALALAFYERAARAGTVY